jgi:hypothetical protein
VNTIPPPQLWDDAWLARIKGMTTGDCHDLVMDFSQQKAVLLVPAKTFGPSSAAYQRLAALNKKSAATWLHIRSLMPEVYMHAWRQHMLGQIDVRAFHMSQIYSCV